MRDLVSYNPGTDTTTVEGHITYDAFGNITNTPAVDILFGFTGRLFDEDTGLQNNLNRWYDPEVGRWLSEDPIGFDADDPNLYRYVHNNPVVFTDPSGLWELRCRRLAGAGWLTFQKHCWVECGGHSYSLLNKNGTATSVIDDPADQGQGWVEASGSDLGDCACIAYQFALNSDTYGPFGKKCNIVI